MMLAVTRASGAPIVGVEVAVYTVPTDEPESDGTFAWSQTTLVVVHVSAGGERGVGYSYTTGAAATIVEQVLKPALVNLDAFSIPSAWAAMQRAIRNLGRQGVVATAIAAVDTALWDLKARLLGLPLARLLGCARQTVPIYGSGGFTSYSDAKLGEQLGGWVASGIPRVKMKVGREPNRDLARVRVARAAIGPDAELFVDANGAYSCKQALSLAAGFAELGVRWFEEPVSSDDIAGLRSLCERAPPPIEVAAGEYGYDLQYFERLLANRAVDVLQADATRCAGISGFLAAATLADTHGIDLSAHCAPALHLHASCAVQRLRHIEYFHDHARIERLLFDGAREPSRGLLEPDWSRPGLGLELKVQDAERFR